MLQETINDKMKLAFVRLAIYPAKFRKILLQFKFPPPP